MKLEVLWRKESNILNKYLNKVICWDARNLSMIPNESIHCIVTSPPYWGLRDYGLEPLIWDARNGCEHQWGNSLIGSDNLRFRGKNAAVGNNRNEDIYSNKNGAAGNFCSLCGCWRGSLGLEPTFQLYLDHLMQIMAECKRVLKKTGTMWVNIGDSYNGSGQDSGKSGRQISQSIIGKGRMVGDASPTKRTYDSSVKIKSLVGIPERFVIRMTDELGMIRRNTIIWWKRNCIPSSAKDRFTVDFECVYFFTKSGNYWFEQQLEPALGYDGRKDIEYKGGPKDVSIGKHTRWKTTKNTQIDRMGQKPHTMHINREYGLPDDNYYNRNKRCVWDIPTQSYPEAHFATFPEKLVEPMILAGCPVQGIVLDPFCGSGTVGVECCKLDRKYIMMDLSPEYCEMAKKRILGASLSNRKHVKIIKSKMKGFFD